MYMFIICEQLYHEHYNITPYFYDCRTEKNRRELQEYGYTVIAGVIPPSQCEQHIHTLTSWYQSFGDEKVKTDSSLVLGYNIGHHPVAWKVRHNIGFSSMLVSWWIPDSYSIY